MSSLRAVVSAASLGTRGWCVLSSPFLRNGNVFASRRNDLACDANFSSTASCLFSEKDTNLEDSTGIDVSSPSTHLENKHSGIQPDSTTGIAPLKKQPKLPASDSFDELISSSRRIFSPSFARDCQYRLIMWHKRLKKAEENGEPVDLEKILTDSFPDVVEFSLTPLSLPDLRLSLLKLLLSQESDNTHTQRILLSTTQDAIELPIGIVAEIVRLLSLAPPTALRMESRCSLVCTVINRRWYEVGAKHLVFFMFQMDEFYDIKTISKQWRQKSKSKERETAKDKKTARKSAKTEAGATKVNESVKESVAENFHSNETIKAEVTESERTPENKRETDITPECSIPIASVNIESRAITLANELKVKDLARVVSLLSRWKSRNEPLLNACLHRLSLADMSLFTVSQLVSLLQSMAALNLHQPTLLDNTTQQLHAKLIGSALSPAQVCLILKALSLLRWTGVRESEGGESPSNDLVKSCLSYLKGCQEKLTVKEAAVVLTSLASLAVTPSNQSERAFVADLAGLVLGGKSPWWGQIHCVWCLSVLQCLDPAILHKVLDPQFVNQALQQVKESASPNSALTSSYKLAQINMAARLEVKGYDGPVLSEEQLALCTQETTLSSEQRKARTVLANTLRKFVDLVTYVNLNPSIAKGVTADAVMCANSEGEVRPLVLREQAGSTETQTEPTFSLALQYIPFSGVNSPGESPTGQYQMAARHLRMLGYTPVQ
ncbi:protein TBRG4, partial [Elysia marginata]